MTAQQTTSNRGHAGSWFSYAWHPALILLFLETAYVGTSILAQLIISGGPLHGDVSLGLILIFIVTLVLFVVEAAGVIKAIRRRDVARAAWQALAIALLVASVILAQQISWAVQFTNLFLFPSVFAACEHNAQPYGRSDAKFNICNAQSIGSGFFYIVYDSGGEISQPEPRQSQSFKDVLKGALLSECKLEISPGQRLRGAFYFVSAACQE